MFNQIEAYQEAGRKAAIAVNQRDAARARFEQDYFRRMVALETPDDRQVARAAYDAAYKAARTI